MNIIIFFFLSFLSYISASFNATVSSSGTMGFDVSQPISTDDAKCMKDNGYTFVIPRAYYSSGSPDKGSCTTLDSAKDAGLKGDVYMFPCPTCSSSAESQLKDMVNYLNSNCKSSWSGRSWLDIEGSQYWLGDTDKNREWYQDLVDACKKNSKSCGIYSSASQWSAIFGSTSYAYGSNLPLWYAHYDGNPSFSDFDSFGGWSKPTIKQFQGDVDSKPCSPFIDKNYAEGF